MRRKILLLACCAALAGCGADGEPEAPTPRPDVQVTVEYGVSGSF